VEIASQKKKQCFSDEKKTASSVFEAVFFNSFSVYSLVFAMTFTAAASTTAYAAAALFLAVQISCGTEHACDKNQN